MIKKINKNQMVLLKSCCHFDAWVIKTCHSHSNTLLLTVLYNFLVTLIVVVVSLCVLLGASATNECRMSQIPLTVGAVGE